MGGRLALNKDGFFCPLETIGEESPLVNKDGLGVVDGLGLGQTEQHR